MDYPAPLLAKSTTELPKISIVQLFVCGITRALHLEVVISLATEEFGTVSSISYDYTMQAQSGLLLKFCLSNGSLIHMRALAGEEDFMND